MTGSNKKKPKYRNLLRWPYDDNICIHFFTELRQLRVIRELLFIIIQVSSAFFSGFSAWNAIKIHAVFFCFLSRNDAKSFKSSDTFFLECFQEVYFWEKFTSVSRCLLVPLGWCTMNHKLIVMYSCKKRLNKAWVIYSLFSFSILENRKLGDSYQMIIYIIKNSNIYLAINYIFGCKSKIGIKENITRTCKLLEWKQNDATIKK